MDWVVYIIQASNNAFYTGVTNNIERRWEQHCGKKAGGAKYFNGRTPIALVYLESGFDRSSAAKREYDIKQMTRKEKERLLEEKENQASIYKDRLPVL